MLDRKINAALSAAIQPINCTGRLRSLSVAATDALNRTVRGFAGA